MEGAQLGRAGRLGHEAAPVLAQGRPRHQRGRAARDGRRGGRHHARVGGGVGGREAAVGPVEEPVGDDLAGQDNGRDQEHRRRDRVGHQAGEPAGQQPVQQQDPVADHPTDQEQHAEHDQRRRDHGRQHRRPHVLHADQVALLVLPPGPQREPGHHHHGRDHAEREPRAAPDPWGRRAAEPAQQRRHAVPGQRPQQVPDGGRQPAHGGLGGPGAGQHAGVERPPPEQQRDGHAAEGGPAPQPAAVSSRFLAHVPPPATRGRQPDACPGPRISPRLRGVAPVRLRGPARPGPAPGSGAGACRGPSRGRRP